MGETKRIVTVDRIGEICEKICRDYCKWPVLYDEEKEEIPVSESEICENCPLNDL